MGIRSKIIFVRPYWAIKLFKIHPSLTYCSGSIRAYFWYWNHPRQVKKSWLKFIACNVDSTLVIKLENRWCDWLCDWFRATSSQSLFLIFNSIVRYSWRKFLIIFGSNHLMYLSFQIRVIRQDAWIQICL